MRLFLSSITTDLSEKQEVKHDIDDEHKIPELLKGQKRTTFD
jgi:hypothetical protein